MKKAISLFITMIMVISVIIVPVYAAPDTKKLVVLGDSISTGYGLDGYEKNDGYSAKDSFANKLAKSAKLKAGTSYQNFAIDGLTTTDLLTTLENEKIVTAIANANTVLISIGGNDFLGELVKVIGKALSDQASMLQLMGVTVDVSTNEKILLSLTQVLQKDTSGAIAKLFESTLTNPTTSTSLAGVAQSYGENVLKVVGAIKMTNQSAKIYIQDVYNPFSGVPEFAVLSNFADTIIGKANEAVAMASAEKGFTVIKASSIFSGKSAELTNMANLDIHPNKKGHDEILKSVVKAMPKVGFEKANGKTYYYGTNNKLTKLKLMKIDGNTYYFDKTGVMATSKFVTTSKKTYYFDKNGKALKGLKTVNKTKYYFNKDGSMVKSKTMTVGKVKYAFDKNGVGKVVKI